MRPGKLYFGDNLQVLRSGDFRDESVDLVYLDPPFNSNREYNVLFKERDLTVSRAQMKAFEDSWHWDAEAQSTFEDLTAPDSERRGVPRAVSIIFEALYRALPQRNDLLAYLVMMAPRLIELRRVLKLTGSLYLHCDPTASHYLKLLLDAIFGATNFVSEVIWRRTNARGTTGRWPRLHDVLLAYSRTDSPKFHPVQVPGDQAKIPHTLITGADGKKYQTYELTAPGQTREGDSGKAWRGFSPDKWGRHWANSQSVMDEWDRQGLIHWPKNTGFPRRRAAEPFIPEQRTVTVGDVWTDIDRLNQTAKERVGYPTQKPVALLERIIVAATDPGDLVLDPFCGCGTTIEAAHKMGREWIGIDITHLAISVIRERLCRFPGIEFDLLGEPQDVESARVLAEESPYQFQWWAIHRVGAHPIGGEPGSRYGRAGADRGIDGILKFRAKSQIHEVIISVKGGRNINPAMVRELRGTMDRAKAAIGVLLTMQEPSAEMRREATEGGFHRDGERRYPRLQLLPVSEIFAGKRIAHPGEDVIARSGEPAQGFLPGLEKPLPGARKGVRIKVPERAAEAPIPMVDADAPRRPPQRVPRVPKRSKVPGQQ